MSVNKGLPKKIIILGGGSAGWITASLLQHAWIADGIEIVLIESDTINKIGVGEGSTPSLRLFFKHLGIADSEWMPACNATYKCGIKFPRWANQSDPNYSEFSDYIHPFYSHVDFKTGSAFIHNAKLRRKGFNVPAHPDNYWLQSHLAQSFKGPIASQQLREDMDYGYHFDSALLGEFLKKRLLNKGVMHLTDEVTEVELAGNGDIKSLITANNGNQSADVFIDCTGFSAKLIRQTLNVDFVDYKESLLNDRAIAIQSLIRSADEIPSLTTSTALSSGWAWRIPLSNRYGNGYVYSSKYISDEDAEAELRAHIGDSCKQNSARVIHFRLGRVSKHWHKNVLAVGLSQGFIEPLEATAIMLIQFTVEAFINSYQEMLTTKTTLEKQQHFFNSKLNNTFENIKDYIVAHYRLNSRVDSQYWLDNRTNQHNSPRLEALLKAWRTPDGDFEAELKKHDAEITYLAPSWYCLFAGKGDFPKQLKTPPTTMQVAPTNDIIKYCQEVSQFFDSHKKQLKLVYGDYWPMKQTRINT